MRSFTGAILKIDCGRSTTLADFTMQKMTTSPHVPADETTKLFKFSTAKRLHPLCYCASSCYIHPEHSTKAAPPHRRVKQKQNSQHRQNTQTTPHHYTLMMLARASSVGARCFSFAPPPSSALAAAIGVACPSDASTILFRKLATSGSQQQQQQQEHGPGVHQNPLVGKLWEVRQALKSACGSAVPAVSVVERDSEARHDVSQRQNMP